MMVGRSWEGGSGYRYGFNGKEDDPETYGDGNIYDYGFRIYNPRLGKFLSVDPLTRSYTWYTPYQFAGNMPIYAIDIDGLEPESVVYKTGNLTKPALFIISMVTGFSQEDLMNSKIVFNQSIHDKWTKYDKSTFGAITLGYNINFTSGSSEIKLVGNWLEMLSHEETHVSQFLYDYHGDLQKYEQGYLVDGLFTIIKEGTTNMEDIHEEHPMEKEAYKYEGNMADFLIYFNYKSEDENGKKIDKNKIVDIFENNDWEMIKKFSC